MGVLRDRVAGLVASRIPRADVDAPGEDEPLDHEPFNLVGRRSSELLLCGMDVPLESPKHVAALLRQASQDDGKEC